MKKLLLGGFVIAGAVAAAAALPDKPPTGVTFKQDAYALIVTEVNASSELNFAEPKRTKHTINLEGMLQVPPRRDVVAVKVALEVLDAFDDKKNDILARTRKRRTRTYRPGTYVPVNPATSRGEVELQKTTLAANAYTIRAMTVQTEVIIAKSRRSSRLAAAVMKEPVDIVDGLVIRISGVKLGAKGELVVTTEYVRPMAGPGGPFLEAVYAVDEDGKRIGGGRWTDGDPFGKKGKITVRLKLEPGAVHKSLRFVAITEDQTQALTFKLTKIFQQ